MTDLGGFLQQGMDEATWRSDSRETVWIQICDHLRGTPPKSKLTWIQTSPISVSYQLCMVNISLFSHWNATHDDHTACSGCTLTAGLTESTCSSLCTPRQTLHAVQTLLTVFIWHIEFPLKCKVCQPQRWP